MDSQHYREINHSHNIMRFGGKKQFNVTLYDEKIRMKGKGYKHDLDIIDKSYITPCEIMEDVLVKTRSFLYRVDFVISTLKKKKMF